MNGTKSQLHFLAFAFVADGGGGGGGGREREREREADRQTDRQTDRGLGESGRVKRKRVKSNSRQCFFGRKVHTYTQTETVSTDLLLTMAWRCSLDIKDNQNGI